MSENFLPNLWYFALPGAELKPGRMKSVQLLSKPILLGRSTDGAVFALLDLCPHRGIPLSYGSFDGHEIACCYHGWRFDCDGHCTEIPSLTREQRLKFKIERIHVESFPCTEVQGNIWIFFGSREADNAEIPQLSALPPDATYKLACCTTFDADVDHAVVGLMDPAHGPFVHRAWWWRTSESIHEKQKQFEPSKLGFTMVRHRPSSNSRAYKVLGGVPETEISFQLPGVRIEQVMTGKYRYCGLTAITPINNHQCRVNHVMYWTVPWLSALKPLVRRFARAFLDQDQRIVSKQRDGLRYEPKLMLINDADQQARWYFQLKREYQRAMNSGESFKNPLVPAELCWRS